MPKKRPPITGQGASVFFHAEKSEPEQVKEKDEEEERVMVTVYLPPKVAKRLDVEWLDRKKEDRKAQKSHVVTEALEAYFQQLDG